MPPITTDLSAENSQTVGFGSLDIHLPIISGEELPQPTIAHSKTAIVVLATWNLYRAKQNGMTTGFSLARAQSAECAREPFVSIPKVCLWHHSSPLGYLFTDLLALRSESSSLEPDW